MVIEYVLTLNIPLLTQNLLIGEGFVGFGTLHHLGMMLAQLRIILIIITIPLANCIWREETAAISYLAFIGDCSGNFQTVT